MLKKIIHWSIANRFLVLLLTFVITGWGLISIQKIPLDAIPDLSDAQVKFTALAEAGQIIMPFAETFWADGYGFCTDRFGIRWLPPFSPSRATLRSSALSPSISSHNK